MNFKEVINLCHTQSNPINLTIRSIIMFHSTIPITLTIHTIHIPTNHITIIHGGGSRTFPRFIIHNMVEGRINKAAGDIAQPRLYISRQPSIRCLIIPSLLC